MLTSIHEEPHVTRRTRDSPRPGTCPAAAHAAATLHRLDQGEWPGSVADLLKAGIIGSLTADPWGGEYLLVARGQKVEIVSLGADGAEGGIGIEADIRYAP